jgi:hypothetical protein
MTVSRSTTSRAGRCGWRAGGGADPAGGVVIRRPLRCGAYDTHGVTLDPDYVIVPVGAPPSAPATPVAVSDLGGHVWACVGTRGAWGVG